MRAQPFWVVVLRRDRSTSNSNTIAWRDQQLIIAVCLDPEPAKRMRDQLQREAELFIARVEAIKPIVRTALINAARLDRHPDRAAILRRRDELIIALARQLTDYRWAAQPDALIDPIVWQQADWGYEIRGAFDDPSEPDAI